MKKRLLLTLFCFVLMVFIFTQPSAVIETAKNAYTLWMTSIFPSLFPFFVLTSILKQTGVLEQMIYRSGGNYHLFFTTLIGYLCGYPSTSKLIGQSETMTQRSAVYALSTAPGPIFIIGTVATLFLQNTKLGYYLLAALYLSLLTTYLLVKWRTPKSKKQRPIAPYQEDIPIGKLLSTAVMDGFMTQLVICGIITTMSIVTLMLQTFHVFAFLGSLLGPVFSLVGFPKESASVFLSGLMEMTAGCHNICQQNITLYHKLLTCAFYTGFGGGAVIMESISFLQNRIPSGRVFLIKFTHGILAVLYARLLLWLFPLTESVFSSSAEHFSLGIPLFMLSASAAAVIYAGITIAAKR